MTQKDFSKHLWFQGAVGQPRRKAVGSCSETRTLRIKSDFRGLSDHVSFWLDLLPAGLSQAPGTHFQVFFLSAASQAQHCRQDLAHPTHFGKDGEFLTLKFSVTILEPLFLETIKSRVLLLTETVKFSLLWLSYVTLTLCVNSLVSNNTTQLMPSSLPQHKF